jgi:ornithine cyclodeaminase/alanine dehydrogenase-like protein (mu-crystallin family)
VLRGKPVRRDPEDIMVFESVGIAYEYLVVACAALERANS